VVCDENGIGGRHRRAARSHHFFYHEASGGKYVPRAELFDLKPGVIEASRASPLGELFRP
jgi:tubulin beta